ncbi:tetratricopeptide repeat protein [Phytohabitans suffuscus]|uniref:MalT-like TPR region domain-containing protein n=1 Tax=Phytohabitans suffuscus TaxID=624315 RepID=A0A6F8YPU7_9ACTN|nr:tetratricopeptide repeat protein [Phytohabitans suffuscus]BCB88150.1 hypothetical protein Psuf_054630 [Phytohabitans suffuscus]
MRRLLLTWVWLIRELRDSARAQPIALHPATLPPTAPDDAVTELVRTDVPAWLDCEQYSFVAAIERAAALDLAGTSAALTVAFYRYGPGVGDVLESFLLANSHALRAARRTGDRAAEAVLLTQLGQLCCDRDRLAESRQHLVDALSILRDLGDQNGEAVVLVALGTTLRALGRFSEALHLLLRAHAYFMTTAPLGPAAGFTARALGLIHLDRGDFAAARTDLTEALAANRRLGHPTGEAMSFWGLSMLCRATGDLDQALELGRTGLDIARSAGAELQEACISQAVAKTHIRLGHTDEATPILARALAICRRLGDRWGEALALRTRGELKLATGQLGQAETDLTDAHTIWTAIDAAAMRARTERDLATLHDARGNPHTAATLRRTALRTFADLGAREHRELTPATPVTTRVT